MNRKLSVNVICALGAFAFIAIALVPSMRGDDADTQKISGSLNGDPSASAPIVLAQGRCFNGRCF